MHKVFIVIAEEFAGMVAFMQTIFYDLRGFVTRDCELTIFGVFIIIQVVSMRHASPMM